MQKQITIQTGLESNQIRNKWNSIAQIYIQTDSGPQTFFYTLSNMLKLNQAKNILQIACGSGKLIPQVLDLKSPDTFYYATDISQKMIKIAQLRLQSHFQKYQSKRTFDEWMKKQKLQFAVLNGQQPLPENRKFDRIICNLVLMHTTDPKKMLKNLWQSAQQDCLLGLTIWGDKSKNNLFGFMQDFNLENNLTSPTARSNFFLYPIIQNFVQQCGWQKVLSWQQNGMYSVIEYSKDNRHPFIRDLFLAHLPQELKGKFSKRIGQIINEEKYGLNFSCKLMIVRKKVNK